MRTPALLLALGVFALQAQAQIPGILIKAKDTRNGQATTIEIRLDKTQFRTNMTAAGEQFSAIFDGPRQLFVQFSSGRKTYTEISKAEMDRVLVESLRQATPTLTPEQQARINTTLRGRAAATTITPPLREFSPGSKDKVGEWPCTNYAATGGAVLCVADPALFGLTAADFDVLRLLEQFQFAVMGGLGAGTPGRGVSISPAGEVFVTGISQSKVFSGIVLRRADNTNPARASVLEVTEIRRETLAPSLFEIPPGLTKESMPVPVR